MPSEKQSKLLGANFNNALWAMNAREACPTRAGTGGIGSQSSCDASSSPSFADRERTSPRTKAGGGLTKVFGVLHKGKKV